MTIRGFDKLRDRLKQERTALDEALERALPVPGTAPAAVHDAIRYTPLLPGKRLRAIFVLWSCEALRGDRRSALPLACAVEFVHASSLVLDDLPSMDGASLRRGRPTLHRVIGEDQATLAAVALMNLGFQTVLRADVLKERARVEAASRLAAAIGPKGLIGGQAADLAATGKKLDLDTLEYIHAHKTGALFIAAAELGAIAAGRSGRERDSLCAFAKNLGLAFQITDDLLDYSGSPETTGKDVGLDRDKSTFVDLCGIDGSRKLVDELIDAAMQSIETLGRRGRRLGELAEFVRERDR